MATTSAPRLAGGGGCGLGLWPSTDDEHPKTRFTGDTAQRTGRRPESVARNEDSVGRRSAFGYRAKSPNGRGDVLSVHAGLNVAAVGAIKGRASATRRAFPASRDS